jgi:hypothetical protein
MATPYITVQMLLDAPTGVSWSLIPQPRSSSQAQRAEVNNVCWRATSIVDTYCRQVLRATVDNEPLTGPGAPRVGVERSTGNGTLIMRRWPVTQVLAIQRARNAVFPRVWSAVPAGLYEVTHPLINQYTDSASATMPDGAQAITVAPGYVDWLYGRNGWRYLVSYVNGWPHTSLTATAATGTTTLAVDDVTGFAGASAFAYDGADTESVSVSTVAATTPLVLPNGVGTAQTGPGTLTLSAPLASTHLQGVVVSALPANVLWASVLACATQALESGIEAVTIQNLPGSQTVGGHGVQELEAAYETLLTDYRRVI